MAVDRSGPADGCGPVLVEGPVEIVLDDGTTARSDRFMVAVCTCRRSRTYPWCDTSHRPRERATPPPEDGEDREARNEP
nr:CDGSH iron-sulfur domain-containing protein [Streptomyces venezuelae]